jgi:hypothetical protein
MHPRLIPVSALIAVAAAAGPAAANIVNIQGSLATEPEPGWSGTLTASLDWRTGNSDLMQVGGSAALLFRHGRIIGLGLARGEYGEGAGVPFSERSFEHLRLRFGLDEDRRWMWEAFAQHEYDAFRRLEVRALAGTGPALRVIDAKDVWAVIGAAYLVEYERFDEGPYADSDRRDVAHRASVYATASLAVDTAITASQTVYVQPRLADPADLRFFSETALTSKLRSWLAITSSFIVAIDRTPPESIDRVDTQLKTALALTW